MLPQIIKFLTNPSFNYAEKKKYILEQKIFKVFSVLRCKPSWNMKKLLTYVDKMNYIFKPFSPCKKRCSKCCYLDVTISSIEISMIEKHINKRKDLKNIKRNRNTVKTIFENERENGKIFGELSGGKKCPFLRDNECSIYNIRPYVCRKYFLLFEKNNEKCGYNNGNANKFNSEVIEIVYYEIISYDTNKDLIPNLNQELFEIHDCFHEVIL